MIWKTNSSPKSDYSHIQNYSPFLSRVTKGKVSSRRLIGRASISVIIWSIIVIIIIIIILSIGIRWGGEGVGSGVKPPIAACRHAIQPTWTFTWYNSVESVSRRASMRCSYAMTSPKDISPEEEKAGADGVDRDGAEREEGTTESVCRDRNWASLRLTVA